VEQQVDDAETISVTPEQAMEMAVEAMSKGHLAPAIEMFRQIVAVNPDFERAWVLLGVATFHKHGAKAALEAMGDAVKAVPSSGSLHNNLGNIHVELGDIDSAVDAYDKAIEVAPEHPDAYANLAAIVRHAGNEQFAERLLRTALKLNPELGVAHHNLAAILLDTKRPREAIDHFWKARVYLSDKALPSHFLAMAYWNAGLKDEARDFVRKWAAKDVDDPQAQHVLAAFTGEAVPERAKDTYVRDLFDKFAKSFDSKLDSLGYRAPTLVGDAVAGLLGGPRADRVILDTGCGTGKCAKYLRPYASQLVGVDLSGGMLEQARKLGAYDALEKDELTSFLQKHNNAYDVVISADTLCYFGRLEEFADAAIQALRVDGILAFTVEALLDDTDDDYRLAHHGRYLHLLEYLERVLTTAGFGSIKISGEDLRMENGEPVRGYLVTAAKPKAAA
jgi:predicted TPR repeat methyltransferase